MSIRSTRLALAAAGFAASGFLHAQGVTDQMIQSDAATSGNVLTWGLTTNGERYSPLKQVNARTVARLAPVWAFSFGGEKQCG